MFPAASAPGSGRSRICRRTVELVHGPSPGPGATRPEHEVTRTDGLDHGVVVRDCQLVRAEAAGHAKRLLHDTQRPSPGPEHVPCSQIQRLAAGDEGNDVEGIAFRLHSERPVLVALASE